MSAEALDALRRIVQALRESSRAAERHAGLSGAQLFVLRAVAGAPGLSLNDLAARTRTHQSSVSTVVTRLVRGGLLARRTAKGDARRAELQLSARGRRALDRAPRTAHEQLVDAVDALPPADRRHLARILDAVLEGMAIPGGPAAMFLEASTRRGQRSTRSHA